METTTIVQATAIVIALGLVVWAIITVALGGQVEVDPGTALVYKNIITGHSWAKMPGVSFLMPNQKEMRRISTRNESIDPPGLVKVNTNDPIQVSVDWIFQHFRVIADPLAIQRVFEEINYDSRQEDVLNRVHLAIKDALNSRAFDQIYEPDTNKLQSEIIKTIEGEINLVLERLKDEWGLKVVIGIKEIKPPALISDAREDKETAQYLGDAIKTKAEAAGNGPNVQAVILADALADAVRLLGGGKGK